MTKSLSSKSMWEYSTHLRRPSTNSGAPSRIRGAIAPSARHSARWSAVLLAWPTPISHRTCGRPSRRRTCGAHGCRRSAVIRFDQGLRQRNAARGVRLQGMRIAEIGHSTRSTRSRERGFCQRTTRSGSGFDQRCRHRRTSATSPPSIWSASPTAPACPPTNGRTAAVQHSAADPARTRRPATFATPIRSCSASATTSANVGNTVRTAASGRPDRDRTAIERPSRLTHADLVEFSAPEPATVPTMGLLAVTVVAIAAARR